MNIAQIKQLDVGMSGIVCTGNVGYLGDIQRKTGTYDGRDYNFLTQFITIKDSTDEIGANLRIRDGLVLLKGQKVTIEKAILQSYIKNGETRLSLRGTVQENAQTQPQPPQAPQQAAQGTQVKEPDWDAIAEGKVRHGLVCAYIQGGTEPLIDNLEKWKTYIMTGHHPDKVAEPDQSITEPEQQTQTNPEDDIPF
jgi:hypothetical protein